MDLSKKSLTELVQVYSSTVKELRLRGILKTKNFVAEVGERLVFDLYNSKSLLPTLQATDGAESSVSAMDENQQRYKIKSTSCHMIGSFYGLNPPGSQKKENKLFDYLIICKFDDDYSFECIYQTTWETFCRYKRWNGTNNSWNLILTKDFKNECSLIFDAKSNTEKLIWCTDQNIDHNSIRNHLIEKVSVLLKTNFRKDGIARFVSEDRNTAVFILSAKYTQKNKEYWYSINARNIPWIKLYPNSYILFSLGSVNNTLLFKFSEFEPLLTHCLMTVKTDSSYYHISFSVNGNNVFFKQKKPEHFLLDVSTKLMRSRQ